MCSTEDFIILSIYMYGLYAVIWNGWRYLRRVQRRFNSPSASALRSCPPREESIQAAPTWRWPG